MNLYSKLRFSSISKENNVDARSHDSNRNMAWKYHRRGTRRKPISWERPMGEETGPAFLHSRDLFYLVRAIHTCKIKLRYSRKWRTLDKSLTNVLDLRIDDLLFSDIIVKIVDTWRISCNRNEAFASYACEMFSNKRAEITRGTKDEKWSTKDKLNQYRGILKLHGWRIYFQLSWNDSINERLTP